MMNTADGTYYEIQLLKDIALVYPNLEAAVEIAMAHR